MRTNKRLISCVQNLLRKWCHKEIKLFIGFVIKWICWWLSWQKHVTLYITKPHWWDTEVRWVWLGSEYESISGGTWVERETDRGNGRQLSVCLCLSLSLCLSLCLCLRVEVLHFYKCSKDQEVDSEKEKKSLQEQNLKKEVGFEGIGFKGTFWEVGHLWLHVLRLDRALGRWNGVEGRAISDTVEELRPAFDESHYSF